MTILKIIQNFQMNKVAPVLSKSKIVVVSHIFASGPAQALIEYLTEKNVAEEVIFIGHPLLPVPGKPSISFLRRYVKGKRKEVKTRRNFGPRFSLHYLENFLVTVYWLLKRDQKWNVFIGANNLNAFSGIILKLLGRANKVIFYCVDYAPKRFGNPIVNYFYHFLDRLTVCFADEIWNLSPRMVEGREKYKHLVIDPRKNKIVPMGIWFTKIKRVLFSKVEKNSLVFMGHLMKEKGVQSVIKAVPLILKEIPDFKFLIIGKGEYEDELKQLVKGLSLGKKVIFAGYIADHEKMENMLARCAVAVALYERGDLESNFTYYADPGKIKDYLGAGLPVMLSNVPPNAREIEKAGCGIVIGDDKKEIAAAVVKFMSNESELKQYRERALSYGREFDWEKIFNSAFAEGLLE